MSDLIQLKRQVLLDLAPWLPGWLETEEWDQVIQARELLRFSRLQVLKDEFMREEVGEVIVHTCIRTRCWKE